MTLPSYTPVHERLAELESAERYWLSELKRDPTLDTWLGFHRDDGSLPDISLEALQSDVESDRRILRRLQRIDTRRFPFDRRLDVEVGRSYISNCLAHSTTPICGRQPCTVTPDAPEEIGDALLMLLQNDALSSEHKFESLAGRIKQIPRYLRQEERRLDAVVPRWRDHQVACARGLYTFLDQIVQSSYAAAGSGYGKRLESAVQRAKPALDEYVEAVMQKPRTGPIFRGVGFAEEVIGSLGVQMTPGDLYRMAVDYTDGQLKRIEEAKNRVCEKRGWSRRTDFREIVSLLRDMTRLPGIEAVAPLMDTLRRAERYASEQGLPEARGYGVKAIRTPPYSETSLPMGALFIKGPFESHDTRHLLYLPVNAKDGQISLTSLELDSLILHEAIPGHAYHLTHTNGEKFSLTRRLVSALDTQEGFACMAESMASGFCQGPDRDAPEKKLLELAFMLRLGPRVCIDLYLMTGKEDFLDMGHGFDPRSYRGPLQRAEGLLRHITGFDRAVAESEVGWYSQCPGYPLSYLVGYQSLCQMKRDAKRHLGPGYSDSGFFNAVLEAGNIPTSYVRRTLEHHGFV